MGGITHSVVIPTYNRAKYLTDALRSVFEQGCEGVEVIVVDDGSTDGTREAVSQFGVRYVYQENRGTSAAKNLGINLARGELVSFLDSDDVWLPGKMRLERELFMKHPEADAVVTDHNSWVEGRLFLESGLCSIGLEVGRGPRMLPRDLDDWVEGKLFATCCLTMRRPALLELGPEFFDVSLQSFEDWDFEVRMLRRCRVLVVPRVLASVRRFDDGTRVDRPFSGRPPTPGQRRTILERRRVVLDKAVRMGGWTPGVAEKLEAARGELAAALDAGQTGVTLSAEEVARYERDGAVFPVRVLDEGEAARCRAGFEELESRAGDARGYLGWTHLFFRWACDLALNPSILDAVEQLIGRDILVYGTLILCKHPQGPSRVRWHQDGTHSGLHLSPTVTAWVALSDSTPENGCMRVVPGSHRLGRLPHAPSSATDNLLKRSDEVQVEIDEASARDIVLRAGEMSLHHYSIVHGSNPNRSDAKRIGFIIRYVTPQFPRAGAPFVRARGAGDCAHLGPLREPSLGEFEESFEAWAAFSREWEQSRGAGAESS
ncbi:MAG: glycosyltransferase [Acidobacteria bacterium]|nr:glycosyltransferase [Acidobacteriota bacterium]